MKMVSNEMTALHSYWLPHKADMQIKKLASGFVQLASHLALSVGYSYMEHLSSPPSVC